jgi:hypothetical protein
MIDTHTISKALRDQIKNYGAVKDLDPTIMLGDYVNTDPSRTPWIGVYRDEADHEPHTLGHNQWRSTIKNKIVIQEATTESGERCQELLDNLLKEVSAAILSDLTIGGAVLHTSLASVQFTYIETDRESLYYQGAIITITSEARSNV